MHLRLVSSHSLPSRAVTMETSVASVILAIVLFWSAVGAAVGLSKLVTGFLWVIFVALVIMAFLAISKLVIAFFDLLGELVLARLHPRIATYVIGCVGFPT